MQIKANKNTHEHHVKNGWEEAIPLENYSSLHKISLPGILNWKLRWPKKFYFLEFSFNLRSPASFHPQAYLTFHASDASQQPFASNYCYSITNLKRWRLDISPYTSFEEYINSMIRWNRCNYFKAEKTFKDYGCEVTVLEGDWSEHSETVYQLYLNVAKRHGNPLYDSSFFHMIAKRSDYKLLCSYYEGKMVALFVLQEEGQTLHSICCGFDYNHSSKCYAYSWLHYELIRWAIEARKYHFVDVGLTADHAKKAVGFEPIPARLDIYSKSGITKYLLGIASKWVTATITPDAKLKFQLKKTKNTP